MKTKAKTNKFLLFIFIISSIIILKFIIHFVLYDENFVSRNEKSSLKQDGYITFKQVLSEKEIHYLIYLCEKDQYKEVKHYLINHEKLNKYIHKNTNINYIFQDYVFIIKRSSIHTCHRDTNGDFFNENQKHPSYTLIVFLEDMDKCLGVIPKSHFDINSFNINQNDEVVNLLCDKGDVILFNANLIHVGALNYKNDNLRIQMKVTHKDDIEAIPFYNQYNKILDEENNIPFFLKKAQRKLSCMFPIVSNYTQMDIKDVAKGGEIGIVEKIYSYLFYGKSNYFDLPNAF
jgi:hypothetical protein